MMENILSQRVTPLLKCVVLFLFIFTAKVLTSRPQDSQDPNNDIHQLKPYHYVRTFTKYHHRRTIQWNSLPDFYWTTLDHGKNKRSVDTTSNYNWLDKYVNKDKYPGPVQGKRLFRKRNILNLNANFFLNQDVESKNWPVPRIKKRSVSVPNSNEFIGSGDVNKLSSKDIVGTTESKSIGVGKINSGKNVLPNDGKIKDKNIGMTVAPPILCLYKLHRVSISATPSYEDEQKNQMVVENYSYDIGQISETTLPNGDIAQVEQCTDTKATCYALWHRHFDGNITILGQGCWHSSQRDGRNTCDKCTAIDQMQGTKFCCCTKSYCNADFLSLKEELVTMKAESTMESSSLGPRYSPLVASVILALACVLVKALLVRRLYCRKPPHDKDAMQDSHDLEKGDVMGSGPDALATGLLCVDNLTLIEHIGQGKFGSVWRGSLGSTSVAVKLYSNANAWQKEAAIYALPHLSHSNILKYYGSDTRPTLTEHGGREHLLVLELCWGSLRARLERDTLTWQEFANLAHGLASALAHLHTPTGSKPCVVHRDVNSNNVLVSSTGQPRLADLGLAQILHPRRENAPSRITEAGTLRYLSPEALEGALDLSGACAALCAVDVFALGLVVWEALWRAPAHAGPPPPYAQPYAHHGLPSRPTLHQMQTLVSRNKARPPLPKGPVPESRALKIAADTCDECWDHDAEARLTAVCVEERMAELKAMLTAHGPVIHDNNLHSHLPEAPPPAEPDKKSNWLTSQTCDATTPLLYPAPHVGRNACIERNTHVATTGDDHLVHKSLKDISAPEPRPPVEENCLSVARLTRMPARELPPREDARSYQRPLEYVPNDVSSHEDRGPKQTNLLQDVKVEKPRWGIRRFFDRLNKKMDTEVKLVPESSNSIQNGKTKTSIIEKQNNYDRPTNLVLNQDRIYNLEGPCTLSPPNRTLSPTMMIESELNPSKVFGFKELPCENEPKNNQIYAVIVPKGKMEEVRSGSSKDSSDSINKYRTSLSSQSIFKSGHSESEDSTVKKRLSCDNRIISSSGRSSRASINLELQYITQNDNFATESPFDLNSDCSSSEDEQLMLLSENGNKITMQPIPKQDDKRKYQNEVLKEASQVTDFGFNKFHNNYSNFDNESSDPNDKENSVNGYSVDNPVYIAALNGEIDADSKFDNDNPKPCLKSLVIKRQHSLEQVSELFSSSGDLNLLNPAGRVKTPGDLPVAVRRARRDRALQKGRANECNRLSLYDDRMMFGNSL